MKARPLVFAFAALAASPALRADSVDARCDIYPAGEDKASAMLACVFSQRQGYVTIARADGVTYQLAPEGETAGNFRDQDGRPVYRQGGLGDQGLIFRLPDESVYVYWSTDGLEPAADPAATRP